MKESFVKIGNEHIFLRHSKIIPYKLTLLFVHGIGESGLCFKEALEDERFGKYNILIPDLVGYGRSSESKSGDNSFGSQIDMLFYLIKYFELNDVVLLGHSMGGDITTLLCSRDKYGKISKYINIEGDLTQHDLFVSSKAVEADRENRFPEWFENFFEMLSNV